MLKFHFFWECHVGISYKEMFLHLPCCSGTGELEVMVRIEALATWMCVLGQLQQWSVWIHALYGAHGGLGNLTMLKNLEKW